MNIFTPRSTSLSATLITPTQMKENSSLQKQWEARYAMVDAWRGLAALGVVCYHLGVRVGSDFDLGHACVMVFFVISGYCIAASTDSCKRNKVGPGGYMWRRVRRIYPPYFFSLCFFAATRLVKFGVGSGSQLSTSPVIWINNLTMTQWLNLIFHPTWHPFDNPTLFVAGYWSLNYEEQFYLVMGLVMFGTTYFKKRMLAPIVALMLCSFVWNLPHSFTYHGFFWEYWVSFALGALVFNRLCKIQNRKGSASIDLGILALLLFSSYRYYASNTWSARWLYTEWILTSTFALMLIYLRSWDTKFRNSGFGAALGTLGLISYSLYLTHQFNLGASSIVASQLIHLGLPKSSEVILRLIFICAVATIFWFLCERPFLNNPLGGKSLAKPRMAT